MAEDGWLEAPYPLKGKRIWIAGHNGMVGAALLRKLPDALTVNKNDLDLRNQASTHRWMRENKPDAIILAAAKVGGILANNTQPADFLYDNLMIEANIIHAAYEIGVEKLLFLGSSCTYPKEATQPIKESALLSGPLEPTNEAYALAKISGIKMCEAYRKQYGCDFISAMPCNLYGPGDHFDEQNSHVIPALMMKAHKAKMMGTETLEIWGSGKPLREFLYGDDLAEALVFLLQHYSGALPVNIGSGEEITISTLARMITDIVGFKGELVYDTAKPDGPKRKIMDSSRIYNAGWHSSTALKTGLENTYRWYQGQAGIRDAA